VTLDESQDRRHQLAQMPKVELHVHLEGSIRPETVLKLAERNGVSLPAKDISGLRDWYRFRNFPHFVEVYVAISKCIRTPEDLELIGREFLEGQADQNILHSEVTYTAITIAKHVGIPFDEQMAALRSAMDYGRRNLGTSMNLILDIVRGHSLEDAMQVAEWTVESFGNGVCALGLAGEERLGTSQYAPAFALARQYEIPVVPHAGETCGPEVIWDCINLANAVRIGHGVRSIEDPELIAVLRERQIPLEVCPTSNICLGVYPDWTSHSLKQLLDEGLYVTLNSDDPPMFNTTLTDEYTQLCENLSLEFGDCRSLAINAAKAALLPEADKVLLIEQILG